MSSRGAPKKAPAPPKKISAPTKASNKILTTLPKMWNKFQYYGALATLVGSYSQLHKRFKGVNRQGERVLFFETRLRFFPKKVRLLVS